ncbi:MAG TPA: AI-2E family transporter [Anaeromyxobacteraceae bacterium]|nr:AI-2E family transporter [Anaeromyxobacteraceae bacterium]
MREATLDTPASAGRRTTRAALRVIACVALALGVWQAREVLLLGFVGVLVAVVFSFPVRLLERVVPRGVAVILVLVALVGGLGSAAWIAAPALNEQVSSVRESAPRAVARARKWIAAAERGDQRPAAAAKDAAGDGSATRKLAETAAEGALGAAVAGVSAVIETVLVIVLAAFLVHEPDLYRRGIRRLAPRRHEAVFDELWRRLADGLRRWVGGILVAMCIMGTLTAAGLLAAGIENWLLLGGITFLGTFVPYVGAVASAIPGLVVAFGESTRHFWLALSVYVGIHVIEGYIVEPLVMRRAVELNPALLLGGQAVFGAIFGPLGLIVASPAMVCIQIAVEYLWVEHRLQKSVAA